MFDTALGRIGVLICYDSEFPLLARAQIEAGAQLLLVPSCTDSLHGYWRVRLAAQARALEGQCYAIQAPLVGNAEWSPAIDINRGAAGIFGPPDGAFPDDGIGFWKNEQTRDRAKALCLRLGTGLYKDALGFGSQSLLIFRLTPR